MEEIWQTVGSLVQLVLVWILPVITIVLNLTLSYSWYAGSRQARTFDAGPPRLLLPYLGLWSATCVILVSCWLWYQIDLARRELRVQKLLDANNSDYAGSDYPTLFDSVADDLYPLILDNLWWLAVVLLVVNVTFGIMTSGTSALCNRRAYRATYSLKNTIAVNTLYALLLALSMTACTLNYQPNPQPLPTPTPTLSPQARQARDLYSQAQDYGDQGNYEKAIAALTEAIRLDSGFGDAYRERAGIYVSKGDYTSAMADYAEAIRLNPRDAIAFMDRAYAHLYIEEYEQALADLDRADQLNYNQTRIAYARGLAYEWKGDPARAIEYYTRAILTDPNAEYAYEGRGRSYSLTGEHNLAIKDLDKSVQLRPEAGYYVDRAVAYGRMGSCEQAFADIEQAFTLSKSDGEKAYALAGRGQLYAMQGKTEQAKADLNQALKLSHDVLTSRYAERELEKLEANSR